MRILAALALMIPVVAQALPGDRSLEQITVMPQSDGFSIATRDIKGPRHAWCIAGRYAQITYGAPANARIYLRGETGGQVGFTLTPVADSRTAGQGGNYSLTLREPGYNLLLSHAVGFCVDEIDDGN